MKVLGTGAGLREELHRLRAERRTIGFVPTMGALHDGHISLIESARKASDVVVLSIFVNPLQFGPKEDFGAYPRTTKKDLAAAHEAGVDFVFLPELDEMYPQHRTSSRSEPDVKVSAGALGEILEGASRPGHFDGVATVVAKLFNLVRPDKVFFGQKDAQQVAVIKNLIRDLSLGIELVVCPTIREPDGLAMSSRNAYLTPEQRKRAALLYAALRAGAETLDEAGDPTLAEKKMLEVLGADPNVEVDYARAVTPDDFRIPSPGEPVLLVVAAKIGRTRLIDNLVMDGRGEAEAMEKERRA